jgi:pteridine reductase
MMRAESTSAPVALVTGAAKRIGSEIVKQLHEAGFRVVIHCHQSYQTALTQVAQYNQQRSHSAYTITADLCQSDVASQLIGNVINWAGQLDLLVNNASIFSKHNDDWADMFACNVHAPYELSMAAFPHLVKTQGSIINITDIHAQKPLRGYAAYCQSKAALAMQTQALALEFAPSVRVNAIAPGAIVWPEGDNQLEIDFQARIVAKTLLQRHGHPRYIAKAVLYLANNDFVTGQSLSVDGGR